MPFPGQVVRLAKKSFFVFVTFSCLSTCSNASSLYDNS